MGQFGIVSAMVDEDMASVDCRSDKKISNYYYN